MNIRAPGAKRLRDPVAYAAGAADNQQRLPGEIQFIHGALSRLGLLHKSFDLV
jgi:hypothetical protein